MKKAIFFDLDGTLLDTLDALYTSVKKVFRRNNLKVPFKKDLAKATGNGARNQILRLVDTKDDIFIDKILKEYVDDYNMNYTQKTKVYSNIITILKKLKNKNIKIAIVSNKPDPIVKKLHQLYFKEYIDFAIGQNDELNIKPDFDMIKKAMEVLEIESKEDILYVGDSEVDILTATLNNIDYIACTYGFRTYEEIIPYTNDQHIVHSTKELKEKIFKEFI